LQFPGGTSGTPNYIGSSDSSGHYSPRTATLDARTSAGAYGGGVSTGPGVWDGPIISDAGLYPAHYTTDYLTIDGLVPTGFSYKAIRIGGASSGDGPSGITGITIQNREFAGGAHNAGDALDNTAAVWIDGCIGATVTNNLFKNNLGIVAYGIR
jgi:hypothetical protein